MTKREKKVHVSADFNEAIVSFAASVSGIMKMQGRVIGSCDSLARGCKMLVKEMARPTVSLIKGAAMFYDGMTMVGGFVGDRIDETRTYIVDMAHAAARANDEKGLPTLEAAGSALEGALRKSESAKA